jgi:acetyltransferase-like isoleucine patch superfamily enzyme
MNLLGQGIRIGAALRSRFRNVWFKLLGVKLKGYVWMRRLSIPRQWSDVTIESGVGLDDGVVLLCSGRERADKIVVRSGAYINRYTVLDAHQHIEIGRNCMIGPHCYLTDGDHGVQMGQPIPRQAMTVKPVVVEEEAWLGAGVIVLKGVRIGRGAVIGAGSVVTRDIDAFAIAVGVPARVIGHRETSCSVISSDDLTLMGSVRA